MIHKTMMARLVLLLLLVAAVLPVTALPGSVQAAPLANTAAEIKAAALARVSRLAPGVPVVREEIYRVVEDYAIVIVYPPPGVTDPAMVILHYQDGGWLAFAGPGTDFPSGADRAGAPDSLFDYTNPYIGERGDTNVARIANSPFQTFQNAQFSFQFPSSASAGPVEGAANGSIDLEGPYLAGPPFSGAAYGIVIRDFGVQSDRPLDEWGYDTLQQEIAIKKAEVEAEGGPSSIYQPVSATFFHAGANDIFQIDYFAGDSTLRDFYVQHTGGGSIIGISTRVYAVQNNQGAPLAESAVTLLLQSLKVTGE